MRWIVLGLTFLLLLPFLVYVLSKVATWGRLKATHEFGEKYLDKFIQQKNKQEESDYEKEEK